MIPEEIIKQIEAEAQALWPTFKDEAPSKEYHLCVIAKEAYKIGRLKSFENMHDNDLEKEAEVNASLHFNKRYSFDQWAACVISYKAGRLKSIEREVALEREVDRLKWLIKDAYDEGRSFANKEVPSIAWDEFKNENNL